MNRSTRGSASDLKQRRQTNACY